MAILIIVLLITAKICCFWTIINTINCTTSYRKRQGWLKRVWSGREVGNTFWHTLTQLISSKNRRKRIIPQAYEATTLMIPFHHWWIRSRKRLHGPKGFCLYGHAFLNGEIRPLLWIQWYHRILPSKQICRIFCRRCNPLLWVVSLWPGATQRSQTLVLADCMELWLSKENSWREQVL